MIVKILDIKGPARCHSDTLNERWARVVPPPFHSGIFDGLRDALSIVCSQNYAVKRRVAGRLKRAINPID